MPEASLGPRIVGQRALSTGRALSSYAGNGAIEITITVGVGAEQRWNVLSAMIPRNGGRSISARCRRVGEALAEAVR
jgi:hypothetical protein